MAIKHDCTQSSRFMRNWDNSAKYTCASSRFERRDCFKNSAGLGVSKSVSNGAPEVPDVAEEEVAAASCSWEGKLYRLNRGVLRGVPDFLCSLETRSAVASNAARPETGVSLSVAGESVSLGGMRHVSRSFGCGGRCGFRARRGVEGAVLGAEFGEGDGMCRRGGIEREGSGVGDDDAAGGVVVRKAVRSDKKRESPMGALRGKESRESTGDTKAEVTTSPVCTLAVLIPCASSRRAPRAAVSPIRSPHVSMALPMTSIIATPMDPLKEMSCGLRGINIKRNGACSGYKRRLCSSASGEVGCGKNGRQEIKK